jgi:membrane associated rhomboid family serine protease
LPPSSLFTHGDNRPEGGDGDGFSFDAVPLVAAAMVQTGCGSEIDHAVARLRGGAQVQGRQIRTPVTLAMLVVLAAVFGLQYINPNITMKGAKITFRMTRDGQWYRLLTACFLHANLVHFGTNALSLWNIGQFVEVKFGKSRYLAVYLLSGIAGNVLSTIVNPRSAGLGASGAVFGLVGAAACYFLQNKRYEPNSKAALNSILRSIALNVYMGLSIPAIDNTAHAGGLIGGFLAAFLFGPNYQKIGAQLRDRPRLQTTFKALTGGR